VLLSSVSQIGRADAIQFPTLDEPSLRRLFTDAETWSIFRDGFDPKEPKRMVSNMRFKYVAKEKMFWFYKVGWDPVFWGPTFDWAKRPTDGVDLKETVLRLSATGFAKVPRSAEKAPFRLGVEVVSGGHTYRWTWPVRSGSEGPPALIPLARFVDTLGRKPNPQGGGHWMYETSGSLSLSPDCQSLEPEGSFEAILENRGKEPVQLRALIASPMTSAPYSVTGTGVGSQPFVLQPKGKATLTLRLDLDTPTAAENSEYPHFWFAFPNPIVGVDAIEGPAQLVALPCPLPKTDLRGQKRVLLVPDRIEALHATILKGLDPKERAVLTKSYPKAHALAQCKGKFSGGPHKEKILVLSRPELPLTLDGQHPVERVALVRKGSDVFAKTLDLGPRPTWEYKFNGKRFEGAFHCGVKPGSHADILDPGSKALVDKNKEKIVGDTACFSTSDVYNNWDCFLYHPGKQQFVLWFSQAFAD
jgi:hypothetical protein